MFATVAESLTFEAFLAFELRDGVPMPITEPTAKHEDLIQRLCADLDRHCVEQDCPFVPRQSKQIRSGDNPTTGREESRKADIVVFDKAEWERMRQSSMSAAAYIPPPLVIEVVSTNWADDYDTKFLEYEALRIAEYWAVDYGAFGGVRYIGKPKRSTVTVNRLLDGEYQSELFRGDEKLRSLIFPSLDLTAAQIFAIAD